MRYYILTLFISILFISINVSAQERKPSAEAYAFLAQAKKQMEDGNYQRANLIFRKMLTLKTVLPTEMSYLFAETLYKVGQFENSKNFLEKYLSITDRGSDYYPLSLELEKRLEERLLEIKSCQYCDRNGYRLVPCTVCHTTGKTVQECHVCRGNGIITCPVCTGNGVVITTNAFNEKEYRTCEHCQAKGFITCNVCEGKKEITSFCPACEGTGYQSTDQLCDHLAHIQN